MGTVVPPGQTMALTAALTLGPSGIAAVLQNGTRFELPFATMRVESGGLEDTFVFCRGPDGLSISTMDTRFLPALRHHGHGLVGPQISSLGAGRARRKWFGYAATGVFFCVVIAFGVFLWNVPAILAASTTALPTSVDRSIGDAAFSGLEIGERVNNPVVDGFVREIVARLAPQAAEEFDFRVAVIESEEINAFALPGGQMVVLTGLLRRANNPDQIAGVMAHEFAHVTRRHGLRNVAHDASVWLALRLLLGDTGGWTDLGIGLAATAKQNSYSRDQESDADEEGTRMMLAAGLDPEGLVGFFELLQNEPGSELPGALNWLSTHPDHQSRIDHIRTVSRSLPRAQPSPLASDFAAVQRALGNSGSEE